MRCIILKSSVNLKTQYVYLTLHTRSCSWDDWKSCSVMCTYCSLAGPLVIGGDSKTGMMEPAACRLILLLTLVAVQLTPSCRAQGKSKTCIFLVKVIVLSP